MEAPGWHASQAPVIHARLIGLQEDAIAFVRDNLHHHHLDNRAETLDAWGGAPSQAFTVSADHYHARCLHTLNYRPAASCCAGQWGAWPRPIQAQ